MGKGSKPMLGAREQGVRICPGRPSRGRRCTPASCGGCAPRRACERRAAAAGWQVALSAAKFARLRTLDWTGGLSCCRSACRPLEVPSGTLSADRGALLGIGLLARSTRGG